MKQARGLLMSRNADYKKRIKQLIREVRRLGIDVTVTGGTHWKFHTPEGYVFAPSTSGCRFAIRKVIRELNKKGIEI